jgi:uncharacterized membrane protein
VTRDRQQNPGNRGGIGIVDGVGKLATKGVAMFDRQKLESILRCRFPGVSPRQVAEAANAIMGMQNYGEVAVDGGAPVTENGHIGAEASTRTTVKVFATIAAPLEQVFGLFTGIEHAVEHVSSIQSVEMLPPRRPFGLGTRWRETREVFGGLDSAVMEVTAFERNRGYTITHHKAGVRIETAFAFEPHAEGTSVSIEFTVQTAGLPSGFLTPLNWAIAGKVRHVLNRDLSDLRQFAEMASHESTSRSAAR